MFDGEDHFVVFALVAEDFSEEAVGLGVEGLEGEGTAGWWDGWKEVRVRG